MQVANGTAKNAPRKNLDIVCVGGENALIGSHSSVSRSSSEIQQL